MGELPGGSSDLSEGALRSKDAVPKGRAPVEPLVPTGTRISSFVSGKHEDPRGEGSGIEVIEP